ncbi:MAG: multiheme c-type cytochrome, partial [Deltaproteobacteria bacterium]|nr:multiheme c-type cytochrome [Deltaproteobacteria bacterium]
DRAGQTEARRRFSDQALEQDRDNGYVGAESCRNCHATEYQAWKSTKHSLRLLDSGLIRLGWMAKRKSTV